MVRQRSEGISAASIFWVPPSSCFYLRAERGREMVGLSDSLICLVGKSRSELGGLL